MSIATVGCHCVEKELMVSFIKWKWDKIRQSVEVFAWPHVKIYCVSYDPSKDIKGFMFMTGMSLRKGCWSVVLWWGRRPCSYIVTAQWLGVMRRAALLPLQGTLKTLKSRWNCSVKNRRIWICWLWIWLQGLREFKEAAKEEDYLL